MQTLYWRSREAIEMNSRPDREGVVDEGRCVIIVS